MPKLLTISLIIFCCCINLQGYAQHNNAGGDKAILLKNVTGLPLPESPNFVCSTTITNTLPQIIATANTEAGNTDQGAVIVTSRLKKGKVMIVGSNWYFKKPLLNNTNVGQFIKNTINWGTTNKRNGVQIWGDDTDLKPYLIKQGYRFVPTIKYAIGPHTGIIIITKDMSEADSVALTKLYELVERGGTFVYGSTIADQFNKDYDSVKYPIFNYLFFQMGMVHLFNAINPQNHNDHLILGPIPFYLHPSTIFAAFQNNDLKDVKNGEITILANNLNLALRANADTSAIKKHIIAMLGLDSANSIVPTLQNPVDKSDLRRFLTYLLREKLEEHKTFPPDYIDPATKTFPGNVADTAARISKTITIPVHVGTQGLNEPPPVYSRWHSTGLYVPAGEKVKVMISHADLQQHLQIQIGVHEADDIFEMDEFVRKAADLTKTFKLTADTTVVYSPYGGILLLKIPDTCKAKQFTIQVNGAIKEPYFKLGETKIADWKSTIRNYGTPWAEIASNKLILIVPAYRIRQLDDPDKLMKFWDEVMDADATLADIDVNRVHPERIIVDAEVGVPGAYMFTNTYKTVTPDDDGVPNMLNEQHMRAEGSWGHFHELGHRHQFSYLDFEGVGEVTVNLFTMYVYDKVLHKGIYNSTNIPDKQTVINDIKKYIAAPDFEKWKNDAFLALKMYIEIIEGFGWTPIEQVFKNYRVLPKAEYPKTDAEKRDLWFIQISKATKRNMGQFFDKWKIPISDTAKKQVSTYPVWLPDELK